MQSFQEACEHMCKVMTADAFEELVECSFINYQTTHSSTVSVVVLAQLCSVFRARY